MKWMNGFTGGEQRDLTKWREQGKASKNKLGKSE
jgi:hypothetical protein